MSIADTVYRCCQQMTGARQIDICRPQRQRCDLHSKISHLAKPLIYLAK